MKTYFYKNKCFYLKHNTLIVYSNIEKLIVLLNLLRLYLKDTQITEHSRLKIYLIYINGNITFKM